ncbi:nucleotide-binding alpha-beta plait domain-containing protein [Tanacetum coccineum]
MAGERERDNIEAEKKGRQAVYANQIAFLIQEETDGDWIKVSRNRKGYKKQDQDVRGNVFATKNGGKTRLTGFDKVLNEKAQSFFFTNFPDSWDSGVLWKMFSHYGSVVYVYIAFKRTKKGTRFGFVRFKNIDDIMAFERKLKGILIGDSRQEKDRFVHSFKDVVVGPSQRPQPSILNVRVEEDGYLKRRLEKCWVGKAKKFQVLQNAWDIMKNNGLADCNVKYVGGLLLLFEWESKDAAHESLESNKIWLMQWFDDLQLWDEKVDPFSRLVWLNIEGLRILARNIGGVKSVAKPFGRIQEIGRLALIPESSYL